jgi:hypothetical protein
MRPAHALLVTLLVAPAARASDAFPEAMAEHLRVDDEEVVVPSCVVCHDDLEGGLGTVTKPFGIAMRAQGTEFGDVDVMLDALDALDRSHSDVDRDETPDVDELRQGTDPNDEHDFTPRYGFGCAQTPTTPADGLLVVVVVAALRTLRSRRRTRCCVRG